MPASSAGGVGSVASATGCARTWSRRSPAARPGSGGACSPGSFSARTPRSDRSSRTPSRPAGSCTCSRCRARTSDRRDRRRHGRRASSASAASSERRSRSVIVLAYALAVGWQPSVVRAAVAGSLASLAWIAARPRDRWHALAVGALVLLAWMPQSALEPGFQLSFAAVAAIFLVLPRVAGVPEAYPIPRGLWDVLVVAVACGLVTAPVVWLHFGQVALWTVPANVAAEPAMPPLISLSLAAAAIEPVLPGRGDRARLARRVVRRVDRIRRPGRGGLAVGPGRVAGRDRGRRCPRRRGRAPPSSPSLPPPVGRRRARVGRPHPRRARPARSGRCRPGRRPPVSGSRSSTSARATPCSLEVPGGAVLFDQGPPEANVAGPASRGSASAR